MIKNVVFDFGNVLVHFEPNKMVRKYVSDEQDAKLLEEVVFDRYYWEKLDRGSMTNEETMAAYRHRLPERLWKIADTIFLNWIYNLPEMEGMHDLIIYIKKRYRVRTFLLSNISKYFAEHKEEMRILDEIDSCIFSAVVGREKPNRDIFEYLCQTHKILPEETVFVDDIAGNVATACELGITGYQFDGDAEKLKNYLDRVLNK
ncbi:MAG: HAD family phosphatase [Clostridia bacterium]|nr:HAD family phosphatase [Clostridia bacterium]